MRRLTMAVVVGVLVAATARAGEQRPAPRPPQKDVSQGAQRVGSQGVPQRAKWWQDDRMKAELRLTADQSTRIEEVFQASFKDMNEVMEELTRREEQLSNLISGGNDVTEAQVLKQADQVEAIRTNLSKARTLMLFRMRRVLTPDQRTKLQSIQKQQQHDRERQPGRAPGERK